MKNRKSSAATERAEKGGKGRAHLLRRGRLARLSRPSASRGEWANRERKGETKSDWSPSGKLAVSRIGCSVCLASEWEEKVCLCVTVSDE